MYKKIKAKKDLYNAGRCFTKGNVYELRYPIYNLPELMETIVINDLGEPHSIGSWWRSFSLVKK